VVIRVAHHLQSFSLLLYVIKNELLALMSDVGDSACNRNILLEPLPILSMRGVFVNELANCELNMEFMGIGIGGWVFLEFSNHF
jgi:hypothetical protein